MKSRKDFGMSGPRPPAKGRAASFLNALLRPLGVRLEPVRNYPTLLERALRGCSHPLVIEVGKGRISLAR